MRCCYIRFVHYPYRSWYGLFTSPFVLALTCSLLLCGYYNTVGSIEREEPQHVSFSIAAGTSEHGLFDGPRVEGTYSRFGVPLYDALQGAGARLPYKASWPQSLEWPFRLVLNWELYVLLRIFFSTFVFLLLAIKTLQSWTPNMGAGSLTVISVLLLTPALRFMRFEDWTVEWSQAAACVGIALFLTRKQLYDASITTHRGLFDDWTQALLVFVCLCYLVTGHPGFYPNALFILLPIISVSGAVSSIYRQRLLRTISSDWKRLAVIFAPVTWVLVTVVWELQAELQNQPDWTQARRAAVDGFFPDQAFLGFSRGMLPKFVEQIASMLFSNAMVPITPVLNFLLPPTDAALRTSGGMFFGTFTGLLAVLVCPLVTRQLPRGLPLRKFTSVMLAAQALMFVCVWLAEEGALPLELTPSGAHKTFSMMLPISVVFSTIILSSDSVLSWKVRSPYAATVGLAALYLVIHLGVIYPELQSDLRRQTSQLVTVEESSVFPSGKRSAIAVFDEKGDESSLNHGSSYGIMMSGKSLMQSSAQIRDTNNMRSHTPTSGGYGFLNLSNMTPEHVRETLAFFQIDAVVTANDDRSQRFMSKVASEEARALTEPLSVVSIAGATMNLWRPVTQYADVVVRDTLSNNAVCPVMEQRCPVLTESLRQNVSRISKLSICNDPCLWAYDAGEVAEGQTLIIPVSFDPTLTLRDRNGDLLTTRNLGGFLAVAGPLPSSEERLTVSVSPDYRMYSLVVGSYLPVIFLVTFLIRFFQLLAHQKARDLSLSDTV